MTTFDLTIALDNSTMRSGDDVAEALHTAASRLETYYGADELAEWGGLAGGLFDANGNSVGRWEVSA